MTRPPDASRREYIARVNRVIDHIEQHLPEPMPLARLAEVACFSPFHFHRIFKALTGETLTTFVQRLRVERAASMLVTDPEMPITHIALDCGFASSASFARVFKSTFGMSATEWRRATPGERMADRKIGQTFRKVRKATSDSNAYFMSSNLSSKEKAMTQSPNIQVQELAELNVAYVRNVGPYAGDSELFGALFGRLMQWAGPRGLCTPEAQYLSVPHDDPKVTEEEKLRISVCISVPSGTEAEGDVGIMKLAGGAYAVGHFEIKTHEIPDAWNTMMGDWLVDSGYQPDDRLCYERCLNNPNEHPEHLHIIEICVPVRPL